jgi:hypothetical protein
MKTKSIGDIQVNKVFVDIEIILPVYLDYKVLTSILIFINNEDDEIYSINS